MKNLLGKFHAELSQQRLASQAEPSQAKPSRAKPSQAEPSQAKPSLLTTAYHGLPRLTTAYHCLPRLTTAYHGLPRVTTGYYGLPRVTTGYHGLPRVTTGYLCVKCTTKTRFKAYNVLASCLTQKSSHARFREVSKKSFEFLGRHHVWQPLDPTLV